MKHKYISLNCALESAFKNKMSFGVILKKAALVSCPLGMLALSACATSKQPDVEDHVQKVVDERTILDAFRPEVYQEEARIAIYGTNGSLNPKEAAMLKDFAENYITVGRGNIVISYPQSGPQNGSNLVTEVQRQLYNAGVGFKNINVGSFQSAGNGNREPLIVSFIQYKAKEVDCVPWTQIDPRKTAKNSTTVNFGCATNSNLAAMVADPGDFLGDREIDKDDAARTQVGIEKYRKGELPEVSGTVSGGSK